MPGKNFVFNERPSYNLIVKPETSKLLGGKKKSNLGSILSDVGVGKGFLHRTPCVQELRSTIHT